MKHFDTIRTNREQEQEQNRMQTENQIMTTEEEQTALAPDRIYKNNIYALVDEVKELEQFSGLTDEELKNNKAFFPVLVNYIYNNYIGDLLGNKHGKQVIYKDIQQIDYIFNIYIELVYLYKWNNKPFIVEFSNLTGINKDTIYNWLNGVDNNNNIYKDGVTVSDYLTRERSDIVRKWVNVCEQALLNGADSSTIRDIFILKAKHGYRDNNNDIQITVNHKNIISADDLPALLDLDSKK